MTNQKNEYPQVCNCFHGETAKTNYKKIIDKILSYLNKKNIEYKNYFEQDKFKEYRDLISITQLIIFLNESKTYELIITFLEEKEKLKNNIEDLKSVQNKKKAYNRILLIHTSELKFAKKNKCYFRLMLEYKPIKKITKKDFESGAFVYHTVVDNLFSIIDDFNFNGTGKTCCTFKFNSEEQSIIGGFEMPIDIIDTLGLKNSEYAKDIVDYMGKPYLNELGFSIKNSSFGLEKINISHKKDKYYIGLKTNYKAKKLENSYLDNYLNHKEFVYSLVEAKKDV